LEMPAQRLLLPAERKLLPVSRQGLFLLTKSR